MNEVLAYLFDILKAKNPTIAMGLLLVLGTAHAFFTDPLSVELLGEGISKVGYWVSLVFIGLQGARTTTILNGGKK